MQYSVIFFFNIRQIINDEFTLCLVLLFRTKFMSPLSILHIGNISDEVQEHWRYQHSFYTTANDGPRVKTFSIPKIQDAEMRMLFWKSILVHCVSTVPRIDRKKKSVIHRSVL